MDFATLKADILGVIGRAPSDVCYRLVTADLNQEMRLRVMQTEVTLTGALSIDLPADFLAIESIYIDAQPRRTLQQKEPQALQRIVQTGAGRSQFYTIVDGKLLLDRVDAAESIVLRYYAKLADLSADTDTNDVLSTYPAVYVYGVLAHHAALIRDTEAIGIWTTAYEAEKNRAAAGDRKKGGPPPIPTVRNVA